MLSGTLANTFSQTISEIELPSQQLGILFGEPGGKTWFAKELLREDRALKDKIIKLQKGEVPQLFERNSKFSKKFLPNILYLDAVIYAKNKRNLIQQLNLENIFLDELKNSGAITCPHCNELTTLKRRSIEQTIEEFQPNLTAIIVAAEVTSAESLRILVEQGFSKILHNDKLGEYESWNNLQIGELPLLVIDQLLQRNLNVTRLHSSLNFAQKNNLNCKIVLLDANQNILLKFPHNKENTCEHCNKEILLSLTKLETLNFELSSCNQNDFKMLPIEELLQKLSAQCEIKKQLAQKLESLKKINLNIPLLAAPRLSSLVILLNLLCQSIKNDQFLIIDHASLLLNNYELIELPKIITALKNSAAGILIIDNHEYWQKIADYQIYNTKDQALEFRFTRKQDFNLNLSAKIKATPSLLEKNKIINLLESQTEDISPAIRHKLELLEDKTVIIANTAFEPKATIADFFKLQKIFAELLAQTSLAKSKALKASQIANTPSQYQDLIFKNYNLDLFLTTSLAKLAEDFSNFPQLSKILSPLKQFGFCERTPNSLFADLAHSEIELIKLLKKILDLPKSKNCLIISALRLALCEKMETALLSYLRQEPLHKYVFLSSVQLFRSINLYEL